MHLNLWQEHSLMSTLIEKIFQIIISIHQTVINAIKCFLLKFRNGMIIKYIYFLISNHILWCISGF